MITKFKLFEHIDYDEEDDDSEEYFVGDKLICTKDYYARTDKILFFHVGGEYQIHSKAYNLGTTKYYYMKTDKIYMATMSDDLLNEYFVKL